MPVSKSAASGKPEQPNRRQSSKPRQPLSPSARNKAGGVVEEFGAQPKLPKPPKPPARRSSSKKRANGKKQSKEEMQRLIAKHRARAKARDRSESTSSSEDLSVGTTSSQEENSPNIASGKSRLSKRPPGAPRLVNPKAYMAGDKTYATIREAREARRQLKRPGHKPQPSVFRPEEGELTDTQKAQRKDRRAARKKSRARNAVKEAVQAWGEEPVANAPKKAPVRKTRPQRKRVSATQARRNRAGSRSATQQPTFTVPDAKALLSRIERKNQIKTLSARLIKQGVLDAKEFKAKPLTSVSRCLAQADVGFRGVSDDNAATQDLIDLFLAINADPLQGAERRADIQSSIAEFNEYSSIHGAGTLNFEGPAAS